MVVVVEEAVVVEVDGVGRKPERDWGEEEEAAVEVISRAPAPADVVALRR